MDRGYEAGGHALRVFDVIADVAVHEPRPGHRVGLDDDVDALARREQQRVFDVAIRERLGVARDDC